MVGQNREEGATLESLIKKIKQALHPYRKSGVELLFTIGNMMHEYKKVHGYTGSMAQLGMEIALGIGMDDYSAGWFNDAAYASKKFSAKQKDILTRFLVSKSDIRALLFMKDRDGWIDNIAKKKLTPPYGIKKTYDKRRADKQKEANNSDSAGGYRLPPEMPDMPDNADDETLKIILENVCSRYSIERVERLLPEVKKMLAKRSEARFMA